MTRPSAISRRRLLEDASRISSGIALAGATGLLAPSSFAQGAPKPVTIWIGVSAAEFMWHVVKGRKIDEEHGILTKVQYLDAHAVNQGLMIGQTHVGATEPIANTSGRKLTFFVPELWNHGSIVGPADSTAIATSPGPSSTPCWRRRDSSGPIPRSSTNMATSSNSRPGKSATPPASACLRSSPRNWGPAEAASGERVIAEAAKLGIIGTPDREIIVAL